ncbi:DNA gyrase subunit A [Thermosulfidibacter takaii ABI70S6]|uniref:DNA gyrase subunit A n=2 Tax=Thermosulfidibacter takaii TaxID=412593 RepID=A0A0S3QTY3_THET7|nr:DNA gyrase subunit A [Thermosulfidibacter takaii ABI70S6]
MNMERVEYVSIEEEMKSAYLDYAMSVIIGRALPDARDGLKPVQRRILYAMGELGLLHNKPYKKCARVVGEVLGKYHPHGDAPVYEALVRMAQDFTMRYPLIDGQGNFGSMDGDPPAAMRYTEARLSRIAEEFLKDIDKNTVDFVPNFDGSFMEPVVLPTRVPNLLLNGASGIAVGMATNIPPHNLNEVVDAAIYLVDNPDATIEELTKFIKGPDFPTGGEIIGKGEILKAYITGRGTIKIRGKVEIEQKRSRTALVITEVPYQVNKASLVEKISHLAEEGKLGDISAIRDESNREGIRVVIELKSGEDPEIVKRKLFKFTPLETGYGIILLAIHEGEPRLLTLKDALSIFIEHRKEVILRRTRYDLDKALEREHILEGIKIALDYLDEVIETIRASRTPQDAKEALMDKFGLTEKQAQAILDMRLQRLTGLEREKVEKDLEEVRALIKDLQDILTRYERLLHEVKKEFLEIKEKYGDERRTRITDAVEEYDIIDMIKEEEVVVTITRKGYIKRVPLTEYRGQRRGGRGRKAVDMKGRDFVEHLYVSSTHDTLVIFTNRGKAYGVKVYEVPEASRQARGKPIEHLIKLDEGERVATVVHVSQDWKGQFIMVTEKGVIKKTPVEAFANARRNGIVAVNLDEGDSLVAVNVVDGDKLVIIGTRNGRAVVFSSSEVRSMGRNARGVRGVNLRDGDVVVGMDIGEPGTYVMTVTEKGYGKRTPLEEFRVTGRGALGVIAHKLSDKTGLMMDLKAVRDDDELMIITKDGMAIRIEAKEVPVYSRNASGVKLVQTESEVAAVCRVPNNGD